MTTEITHSNGKVPGAAALPKTVGAEDGAAVVLATGLLAHWWSRPSPSEGSFWMDAAETERDLVSASLGIDGHSVLLGGELDADGRAEEYERLFVGPGHVPCPPYESFWREDVAVDIRRSLMGPCTAALRELYARLELEVVPSTGELPDHVAVELEALAYALSSDETLPVASTIVSQHLRHWLPRLCRAVAHETTVPFYRELADRTLVWLAFAQAYVASLAGDASGTP